MSRQRWIASNLSFMLLSNLIFMLLLWVIGLGPIDALVGLMILTLLQPLPLPKPS